MNPDSLQTVLDSVFAAPAYAWVERPHPLGWLIRRWEALRDWLLRLQEGHPTLFTVLLWTVVAVLVAILAHAAWVFLRTLRHAAAREVAAPVRAAARRDAAWYEREAERLAAAGRHAEAVQAAFAAVVLGLDARGLVRYHPSKTPAEYAREARLDADDRRRLRDLAGQLYRFAFGGAACDLDDYRRWRERAAPEWHAAAT